MSEKIRTKKYIKNDKERSFFKKTLIQFVVSLAICLIMLISVKLGGKDAEFNVLVRKYLFESTDIKHAATSVFNKFDTLIDDQIIPVINNMGDLND